MEAGHLRQHVKSGLLSAHSRLRSGGAEIEKDSRTTRDQGKKRNGGCKVSPLLAVERARDTVPDPPQTRHTFKETAHHVTGFLSATFGGRVLQDTSLFLSLCVYPSLLPGAAGLPGPTSTLSSGPPRSSSWRVAFTREHRSYCSYVTFSGPSSHSGPAWSAPQPSAAVIGFDNIDLVAAHIAVHHQEIRIFSIFFHRPEVLESSAASAILTERHCCPSTLSAADT